MHKINKRSGKQGQGSAVVCNVDVMKRFIAYIVDWFLSDLVMALPVVVIYAKVFQTTDMKIDLVLLPYPYNLLAGTAAIILGTLYFVGLPCIHHSGQTPGKRLCKFKITMEDGSPVHLKALCIRQILGFFLLEGSLLSVSKYIREMVMLLSGIFETMQMLYGIGIFFGVLSILLVVVTKKRRAVHDLLAHTSVRMCG